MNYPLALLLCVIVGGTVALSIPMPVHHPLVSTNPSKPCIPTFQDGDGPYYLSTAPFRSNVRPPSVTGTLLTVNGKVVANDCKTPLAGVIVDFWQANEHGVYVNEWYRGRVITNKNGEYRFQTVLPQGYGEGTAYRPPHIHFKIWDSTTLKITSEMFFPDVRGREGFHDAYNADVVATRSWGKVELTATHTIVVP